MDVCLDNGMRFVLRPIRPRDKALLERGMRRLSPESARLRFLAPKDHLTLAELRYLTEIDYLHHFALVAVDASDPSELIGVGRFIRDPARPWAAECAVAVGDCYQGQGVGTAIGEALADAARARGITEFTATMLAENRAAQRLFARLSARVSSHVDHGVRELAAEITG
jgi:RimJ/RimL family protein N-acetyltransferase